MPEPAPLPEHPGIITSACISDFRAAVAARGHILVACGAWIRCTICRRRCRINRYNRWTRYDCRTGASAAIQPQSLTRKRFCPMVVSDADAQPTCTVNKRRRVLAAQRAEHKRLESSDEASRRRAWRDSGIAVPFLTWQQLRCGTVTPPVAAHHSHLLIACGGYGGCMRCGSVASGNRSQLLEGECRRWCPVGSKGPIVRLAKGLLPKPKAGEDVWPDGSLAPTPVLWRIDPPAEAGSGSE